MAVADETQSKHEDSLSRSLSVGVRTDRDLVDAVRPGEQAPGSLVPLS
jgi:hypothetical protein